MTALQPPPQSGDAPDYLRRALELHEAGDSLAAVEVLRHGVTAARRVARVSERGLSAYARLAILMVNLLFAGEEVVDALRLTTEVRGMFRDAGYDGSELRILVNLIHANQELGDLAAAEQYAAEASRLCRRGGTEKAAVGFPAPPAQFVSLTISAAASKAYYSEDNYERAATLAELAVGLDPESGTAWWNLAFSRVRLKLFAESIEPFDAAISLEQEPAAKARLLTGRAAACQGCGRLGDAIAAMSEAIALFPDRTHYYLNRAYLRAQAGHHEGALDDLDQVLLLADHAPVEDSESRPQPRSEAEYIRSVPATDVRDFAGLFKLRELWELGRTNDALEAATALAADGSDPPTRCAARCSLGRWHLELGDLEQAMRAFTAAVDEGFMLAEALLGRARCLIALERIDGALADLDALCGQDPHRHDPAGAAETLSGLLERYPELTSVRLVLGHALLAAWQPDQAIQQLDRVLAEDPENWQALLWRGMCWITHSVQSDRDQDGESPDDSWNSGYTIGRVWQAVADVVAATRAAPTTAPFAALRWLIDRAMLFDEIEERLIDEVSRETGLGSALTEFIPQLASIFRLRATGGNAAWDRNWVEAAAALAQYRDEAAEAGLPILTAKADLQNADVLLRQFELQSALDRVAAAEMMLPRIGQPFALDGATVRVVGASDGERGFRSVEELIDSGISAVSTDLDHLEFSLAATTRFYSFSSVLKAEALSRLGRPREALQEIQGLGLDVLMDRAISTGRASYVLGLIPIFRDSGEYSQALALIDEIRPYSEDDHDRQRLAGYEATTHVLIGNSGKAEEIFETELARASEMQHGQPHVAAMNLATVLSAKNPLRSLSLLDAFPPPAEEPIPALSDWHTIRGQALLSLDRPDEAMNEFIAALDLRDQVRRTLRGQDARISWHAGRLPVIQLAVQAALKAGNAAALELSERGKARAFVDQLESGHPELTPEATHLASAISNAQRRKELLGRLVLALAPVTHAQDPDELLIAARELSDLGINVRQKDGQISVEQVSRLLSMETAAIQRLEARFQEASSGERESVAGKVSSVSGISDLLQPGQTNTGTRVLLAEYFIIGEKVVLFLLGTGDTLVKVRPIGLSEPELRSVTEPWLRMISQGLATDVESLEAASPLIEPVLESCAPGDLILFVPHGIVHRLPLHAIPAGGQRLIERNPVIYSPSASVLAQCRARRGQRPSLPHRALIMGDSRGDLPHAREEAMTVADLLGVPPLVGDAATKAALFVLESAGEDSPDLIHLACHGVFDADHPMQSGILLASRPGGHMNDAILTAEQVYSLRLRARLVTLSACQSGLSVRAPGEELFGLTRAFMYAGAATVLISLWPVDDLSTGLLMKSFYMRLLGKERETPARPADALRQAQLELMTTTAGDAINHLNARLARTVSPEESLFLQLDIARLHVMAGDLSAAVGVYTALQHQTAGHSNSLKEFIDRRLRLIEFKAEAPTPADHEIRPFDDPRYWAAFAVVGEWE